MSCHCTLIPLREPVALDLPYNINQFEFLYLLGTESRTNKQTESNAVRMVQYA